MFEECGYAIEEMFDVVTGRECFPEIEDSDIACFFKFIREKRLAPEDQFNAFQYIAIVRKRYE